MNDARELLEGIVADVDAVFLFAPSASYYERFVGGEGDQETVPVVGEAEERHDLRRRGGTVDAVGDG